MEVTGLDTLSKVQQRVSQLKNVDVPQIMNGAPTAETVVQILSSPEVRDLMLMLIGWEDFDTECGNDAIDVLACVKVLRYFLNLPVGYVTSNLMKLVQACGQDSEPWNALN